MPARHASTVSSSLNTSKAFNLHTMIVPKRKASLFLSQYIHKA